MKYFAAAYLAIKTDLRTLEQTASISCQVIEAVSHDEAVGKAVAVLGVIKKNLEPQGYTWFHYKVAKDDAVEIPDVKIAEVVRPAPARLAHQGPLPAELL